MEKQTEQFIRGLTEADAAHILREAAGDARFFGIDLDQTELYQTWLQTVEMMRELVIDKLLDPYATLKMGIAEHAEFSRRAKPDLSIANLRFAFAGWKFKRMELPT